MKGNRTQRAWTKPTTDSYRRKGQSGYKLLKDIALVVSVPLPAKRRCKDCGAFLRSGNEGDRCSPCERKVQMGALAGGKGGK
jgi:hypothetical protein